MHVYVVRDGAFTLNEGKPASNLVHYEAFSKRYLAEFESVTMVGRLFNKEDPTALPVEGPGVTFLPLPGYHGPVGFLKSLLQLGRSIGKSIDPQSAYILRVPATIPIVYSFSLRAKGIPFAVEVVGDPEAAYSSSSLGGNRFSAFFQMVLLRAMKWQCRNSCAAAYVTASALQRKYPAPRPEKSFSFTSIDLTPDTYVDFPREYAAGTTLRIVITGNMQKNLKGHDTLIEAMSILIKSGVDCSLKVIGFGERLDFFKRMAKDYGVGEKITFLGKVPSGKAVRDVLDESDLFVLPSRQEGLPRALLEAMARGLPAIATSVGGTPELLDQDCLIDPNDANELAGRIRNMYENPFFMHKCAKRNLDVANRYRIDVVANARKSFYREIIKSCR